MPVFGAGPCIPEMRLNTQKMEATGQARFAVMFPGYVANFFKASCRQVGSTIRGFLPHKLLLDRQVRRLERYKQRYFNSLLNVKALIQPDHVQCHTE